MVWLLRLILFGLIIFFIFILGSFLFTPNRKLKQARKQRRYYLLDDVDHVRKNLFFTFKGAIFEGEKYLGTTDQAIEVVSITIWAHDSDSLKGMVKEDFYFIEKKIIEQYPMAVINWKNPIKELMEKK
ncbi:sigma-w pathway protein ysdB [Neobacillus sp. PS3-40]|uniref:sigma-w pathway protein ysdB n=1 Tax=Neobacillus sp. PS3-40 TaxID=3070679 RepID=UPI0027DEC545|nr:sigma-w pathway protein ysdB [Neobacillus sp. PS3-40]WML45611.1 sigma-w pathway protein ysdB [Neobacillus sp. PS3-40]